MKKTISISTLGIMVGALLFVSPLVMAQDDSEHGGMSARGLLMKNDRMSTETAEQQATKRSERLTKSLDLSTTQATAIKGLVKGQIEKRQALQKQLKELNTTTQKAIGDVLSPEQKSKYAKTKECSGGAEGCCDKGSEGCAGRGDKMGKSGKGHNMTHGKGPREGGPNAGPMAEPTKKGKFYTAKQSRHGEHSGMRHGMEKHKGSKVGGKRQGGKQAGQSPKGQEVPAVSNVSE